MNNIILKINPIEKVLNVFEWDINPKTQGEVWNIKINKTFFLEYILKFLVFALYLAQFNQSIFIIKTDR